MAGIIEEWAGELGIEPIRRAGVNGGGPLREFGRIFNISPAAISRANNGNVGPKVADLLFTLQFLKTKKRGLHHDFKNYCERINKGQAQNVRRGNGKAKA